MRGADRGQVTGSQSGVVGGTIVGDPNNDQGRD
jgi:hypothetical protein